VLAARQLSAVDTEAQIRVVGDLQDEIRRATETEARLRAEIRAFECRANEAEAHAALVSPELEADEIRVECRADGEVEAELGLGKQGPATAATECGAGGVKRRRRRDAAAARDGLGGARQAFAFFKKNYSIDQGGRIIKNCLG